MRKAVRYSAINAKIDKMYSRLLMNTDYIELCHLDTVKDIIYYLQENSEIEPWLDSHMTASECEVEMQRYKINNLKKLSHYLTDDYKKFIKAFLLQYEIADIKRILRVLQKKQGFESLDKKILIMNHDKNFKIDKDMNIPEFIGTLKKTRYYKLLRSYEDETNDVVLFYMEMNLDKYYYSNLIDISKNFSEEDRKCVKNLLGRKIDILNINWIYRGLKYYHLLPEELINFCILGGCEFGYDDLKKLCYSDNIDEFVEEIKRSEYKFLFDSSNTDIYMDRRSNRYLYYIARKEIPRNSFTIGKFLAYIFLLDYEVKDIGAIMEAIRFNISFEETLNYLVRSYGKIS